MNLYIFSKEESYHHYVLRSTESESKRKPSSHEKRTSDEQQSTNQQNGCVLNALTKRSSKIKYREAKHKSNKMMIDTVDDKELDTNTIELLKSAANALLVSNLHQGDNAANFPSGSGALDMNLDTNNLIDDYLNVDKKHAFDSEDKSNTNAFIETSTPADDEFQLDSNYLLSKSDFNYEIDLINEDFAFLNDLAKSPSLFQIPQADQKASEKMNFFIDDYVCINETKYGHVKYQGTVHFAYGIFCGVELEEPVGKHDGEIDNKRYFKCKKNHGLFAPIDKLRLISSRALKTNIKNKILTSQGESKSIKSNSDELIDSEFNEFLEQYKINYINNSFQPIKLDDHHFIDILNDSNYDNNHDNALVNIEDLEADNEVCINLRNLLLADSEQNQAHLNLTRTISNASQDRNERSKGKLTSKKASNTTKSTTSSANKNIRKKSSATKTANTNSSEKNDQSKPRVRKQSTLTNEKSTKPTVKRNKSNEAAKPSKTVTKSTNVNTSTTTVKPKVERRPSDSSQQNSRSKSSPDTKNSGEPSSDKKRSVDGRKASLGSNPKNSTKNTPKNTKNKIVSNEKDKMLMQPKITTHRHHLTVVNEPTTHVSDVNAASSNDANLNSKSTSSTSSTSSASSGPQKSLGLTKLSFQFKLNSSKVDNNNTSNASSIIISTSPQPLPTTSDDSSELSKKAPIANPSASSKLKPPTSVKYTAPTPPATNPVSTNSTKTPMQTTSSSISSAPISKLSINKPAVPVVSLSANSANASHASTKPSSSLLIGSTKLKYSSNPSPPVVSSNLRIVGKDTPTSGIGSNPIANNDYRSLLRSTSNSNPSPSYSKSTSLNNIVDNNSTKPNSLSNCYVSLAHQSTIDEPPNEFMMTAASLNQTKVNDLVINTALSNGDHSNGVGDGGVASSGVFSSSSSSAGTGSSSSSSSLILSSPTTSPSRNSLQINHQPQQPLKQTNIQIPLQIKRQATANLNINIVANPASQVSKPSQLSNGTTVNISSSSGNNNVMTQSATSTNSSRYSSIPSFARSSFHANPKLAKPTAGNNANVSKILVSDDSTTTTTSTIPITLSTNADSVRKYSSLNLTKSSLNSKPNAETVNNQNETAADSTRKLAKPGLVKLVSGGLSSAKSSVDKSDKLYLENQQDESKNMNRTFSIEDYNEVLQGEVDDGLLLSDYEQQKPTTTATTTTAKTTNPIATVEIANSSNSADATNASSKSRNSDLFSISNKLDEEILLFESKFDMMNQKRRPVSTNDTGSPTQAKSSIDKAPAGKPVAVAKTSADQQDPLSLQHIRISRNVSLSDEFLENESLPDDLLVEEMQNFIDASVANTSNILNTTDDFPNEHNKSKDDLQLLSNNFLDKLQFTPSAPISALSALASYEPASKPFFSLPIQLEHDTQHEQSHDISRISESIGSIAEESVQSSQVLDKEVETVLTTMVDHVCDKPSTADSTIPAEQSVTDDADNQVSNTNETESNEATVEPPTPLPVEAVEEPKEKAEESKEEEDSSAPSLPVELKIDNQSSSNETNVNSEATEDDKVVEKNAHLKSSAESLVSPEQSSAEMKKSTTSEVKSKAVPTTASSTKASSTSLASQILSRRLPQTTAQNGSKAATPLKKPTATDAKPSVQTSSSSSSLSRTASVKEPHAAASTASGLALSSSGSALAVENKSESLTKKTIITINSNSSGTINRDAHRSPTPPSINTTSSTSKPIRKVPSTKLASSTQKLKSLSIAEQTESSSNKQDDDVNSVFDADRQSNTSCSSDNEDPKSSVKSLSRAIDLSKAASASVKLKSKRTGVIPGPLSSAPGANKSTTNTTIAHISVVANSSAALLNKTASNDAIASNTTSTPASSSQSATQALRIKGLRPVTNSVSSTSSVKKSSSGNNKENQVHSSQEMPKSIAMNKIYKSRDGLAAVSSNTSIMSELSNISKSSLPNSTLIRQASISSSTSSVKNQQPITLNSQTQASNPVNKSQPTSLLIRQQTFGSDMKQSSSRLGSTNSVKQQAQALNAAAAARNSVAVPASSSVTNLQHAGSEARKASIQAELKSSNGLRRPGVNSNQPSSSNVLSSSSKVDIASESGLLHVNTKVSAANLASSQSPSGLKINSSGSKPLSIEAKLGKEIKRLEALCESRTKELSILKMRLKDTIMSFDGIVVAYNYLANNLNGFEASSLRTRLANTIRKNEEEVRTLKSEIDEKDRALKQSQTNLLNLTNEMNDMKAKLENQLAKQTEEYEIRHNLTVQEHELIVRDLKQEKELNVKRLNKSIETLKQESELQIADLKEQLERKCAENVELDGRIRECEETLAKDKDERIQRLLDIQHNLEKEIESLKTALDIKNGDLFELRTKNNELTTKMENFNELNIKLRRYKQEIEQLSAVLKNKQESERRTSEFNRQLAMKIEIKNRENQRLSMVNEQLQFRLQSQPNLSNASLNGSSNGQVNHDFSFNSLNMSPGQNYDDQYQTPSVNDSDNKYAHSSMITSTSLLQKRHNDEPEMDFIDGSFDASKSSPVKLRSKSFKTPVSSNNSNNRNNNRNNFHMQFRPVSESFDFNINDRDMFMTRSAIMYDDLNMSDLNQGHNVFDGSNIDVMIGESNMGFELRDNDDSVSSDNTSITHVKSLPTSPNSSNQNPDDSNKKSMDSCAKADGKLSVKSAPCMPLKEEHEDQHQQSLHSDNNDTINLETTSLLDETDVNEHKTSSLNNSQVDDSDNPTPKKADLVNQEPHISSTSSSSVTSSSISASENIISNKLNIKSDDNNNSLSSSSLSFNEHSIDY